LRGKVDAVEAQMAALLDTFRTGRVLREGIQVAIVGRPNVGKSSLFNALLAANRAIVTPIPGTTRDVLEEVANLCGYAFRLLDTAGIRRSADVVEQEGMARARQSLEGADLVLLVLDGSEPLTAEDEQAAASVQGKCVRIVVNKADLPPRLWADELEVRFPQWPKIVVSCKETRGLEHLTAAMVAAVTDSQQPRGGGPMVTRTRHWEALRQAHQGLLRGRDAMQERLSGEFIALELREALEWLGEIVGLRYTDDLLDKIFSEFCIGK
jgi:tRNA modification GTPase